MLCLEGCPLYGPNAWDKPHETFSNHSSTRGIEAVISMVASYYGGNLSQDRIAYYVYGEYLNDSIPENDLGHGKGIMELNLVDVLRWAGIPVLRLNGKPDFEEIKYSLDNGRPILRDDGSIEHRITLIDGYTLEGELIHLIDPLTGSETKVPYEDLSIFVVWIPYSYDNVITARSDEPTIWIDSDGDGIVDFDEINRFHTDPLNPDTDGDGIDDKTEIRSYTFLSDDSFDSLDVRKPDTDGDGLRAELDPDSDNDGFADGLEDLNHNGKIDPGETDPFDPFSYPNKYSTINIRDIIIIAIIAATATIAITVIAYKMKRKRKHARIRVS
jgi:hypothetical protein